MISDNPDDGHTFRISVTSRMSSKVVGEAHNTDSDYFGPPLVLEVRAWNLRDALAQAAKVWLKHWQHPEESGRPMTGPHPHNVPETWRDDGKCAVKSCRVYRTT